MQASKRIKKFAVVVSLSLAVSLGVPAGFSDAAATTASSTQYAYSQNSLLKQIFSKAGINYNRVQKPQERSTPPSNSNTNPPAKNPVTEQEQSNDRLALADKIINTGEKYMGTPYQYGARSGQTKTFDCSSFVQYVYGLHGIDLPRNSRQQSKVGKTIPRSQIQKGDLLFFKTSSSGSNIGHVGIYAGNNKVLHTWGPGGVRYDSLSTGWLDKGYVTAKRVIPEK